jgi:hypothetical protein
MQKKKTKEKQTTAPKDEEIRHTPMTLVDWCWISSCGTSHMLDRPVRDCD